MDKSKIISHEIGHGMVAYLFQGEYWEFEGIQFATTKKLNADDLAYTITKLVDDYSSKVDQDNHLAAAIDGLQILAGIVGMTVFDVPDSESWKEDATVKNFQEVYDFAGSEGDFEVINRGNRAYGWYLTSLNMTLQQAILRHVRLLNLLKNTFSKKAFLTRYGKLKKQFEEQGELTFNDFVNTMGKKFSEKYRRKIITYIKEGMGKPILVE